MISVNYQGTDNPIQLLKATHGGSCSVLMNQSARCGRGYQPAWHFREHPALHTAASCPPRL